MVGQNPLGGVRNQDRVADIGIAGFDIGYGQIVRQRAGAHDFHAVIKNENADGRADKIIPVYKGVDQQFLKTCSGISGVPGELTPFLPCTLCGLRMTKARASLKSLLNGPSKSSVSS